MLSSHQGPHGDGTGRAPDVPLVKKKMLSSGSDENN